MKILMFGRGVIATTYGWALEQAGNEVEFYVRPGRASTYGPIVELDLLDARKRPWGRPIVQKWSVRYRETLDSHHDYDLIVVSVAHNRLAGAVDFLASRVSKATILIFGNVWVEPSVAIASLPADQVAWGFPGAGGGFDGDGVLRASILPSVTFGTFGRPPTERERAVRQTFRDAGFRIQEQPDFRGWLWIHFIMDAGLHAQGLRLGSLSNLIGKPQDLGEALLTSRELLPVLRARGINLRQHRAAVLGLHAPTRITASAMSWGIGHVASARRSLEAHTDPLADEPRAICIDALAEARRLGVAVPRLEAAESNFAQRPAG
jgi:2-dehydropantoate 2-reductase